MKKQYYWYESRWPYYTVVLYHDGVEVGVERKDQLEINDYLEQLRNEGYTAGFTDEDIEKARKRYEHMLENRIERKEK